MTRRIGSAPTGLGPAPTSSRPLRRRLVTGAGALALVVGGAGAAQAHPTELPSAVCIIDSQGMMTMPDGMKMPAAQMPGCDAAAPVAPAAPAPAPKQEPAAPKAVTPAPAASTPATDVKPAAKLPAPTAPAPTPQHVHAGTGGQASIGHPGGQPVAPLALTLAALGIAAVTTRRLLSRK